MRIEEITLVDFRNYERKTIMFPPAGLIIAGPNGVGKTNLLEAVGCLATGRSVRRASDAAMTRFGQSAFRIDGCCRIADRPVRITVSHTRRGGRTVAIDEVPIKSLSQLYRYLRVVDFSPDDVDLIAAGPSHRRRFLNQAVAQCFYDYLPVYRDFAQLLKQRNAILEQDTRPPDQVSWDERYLVQAEAVLRLRREYLAGFIPLFQSQYAGIAGHEHPEIVYRVTGAERDDQPLREIAAAVRTQELRRGHSLYGPHHDELVILLDDRPARNYASQGQRRSLSLALRLAQAEMVRHAQQEAPVLMFDDALAELDPGRVERLRAYLPPDRQILIATPNPEVYNGFGLELLHLGE
jgi:DNA replication and repair protein RecF